MGAAPRAPGVEAGRVELRGSPARQRAAVLAALGLGVAVTAGLAAVAAGTGSHVLGLYAVQAAVLAGLAVLGLRRRRGDVVVADADGLHVTARPRTETLRWESLRDLGWVWASRGGTAVSGGVQVAGLHVRRRTGGPYLVGGPGLPGPLAHPVGVTRQEVDALRDVAEAHGAVWADYRAPRGAPPAAAARILGGVRGARGWGRLVVAAAAAALAAVVTACGSAPGAPSAAPAPAPQGPAAQQPATRAQEPAARTAGAADDGDVASRSPRAASPPPADAEPAPPPALPVAPPAELRDPVLPVRLESLVVDAGGPAAAGAPDPTAPDATAPDPAAAPPDVLVATAVGEQLRATSAPGGGELLLAMAPTAPLGGPRTLLVLQEAPRHVRVLLPVRPNGASGWVERSAVSLARVEDRLVVDLSDRTLRHLVRGEEVMAAPVAVGTSATPTPVGTFAVTDLVRPPREGGPFGAAAFGLTGRSEVLDQFGGGDGQLALHGTNRPGLLGTAASNGCVRLGADPLASLVGTVPLGTPVDVVP